MFLLQLFKGAVVLFTHHRFAVASQSTLKMLKQTYETAPTKGADSEQACLNM